MRERAPGIKIYGDHGELLCPRCGSEYLHHGKVEVYHRGEDEPRVLVTSVDDRIAKVACVANGESGNPSPRRDGLRLSFWCENCPATPDLCIAQHKGCSQLWWEP